MGKDPGYFRPAVPKIPGKQDKNDVRVVQEATDSAAYRSLRAEMAGLYDIAAADFDCTHLLRLSNVPGSAAWNPANHDSSGTDAGSSGGSGGG
jgi:hypothetical protein